MAFGYNNYAENERVKKWRDKTDASLEQIEQQKPFAYDVNADALYRNYRDQYMKNARLAMQDTMGQAAAMTGGYGNSYAAAAGNQAYQQQMGKLNDVIPQLYQIAYDRYNNDRQDLYNRANLYNGMYADEFGRDYGMYGDAYDRAFANYQQGVSESQFDRELAEKQREFDLNYDMKFDKQYGGEGVYQGATYSTGDFSNGWQGVDQGGDQETTPSGETDMTKLFKASVAGKRGYGREGDYNSYDDYIKNAIAKWQTEGNGQGQKLTTQEAAQLLVDYKINADAADLSYDKKKNKSAAKGTK